MWHLGVQEESQHTFKVVQLPCKKVWVKSWISSSYIYSQVYKSHCTPPCATIDMVSWNRGTTTSSILMGFPITNQPSWGILTYGNIWKSPYDHVNGSSLTAFALPVDIVGKCAKREGRRKLASQHLDFKTIKYQENNTIADHRHLKHHVISFGIRLYHFFRLKGMSHQFVAYTIRQSRVTRLHALFRSRIFPFNSPENREFSRQPCFTTVGCCIPCHIAGAFTWRQVIEGHHMSSSRASMASLVISPQSS